MNSNLIFSNILNNEQNKTLDSVIEELQMNIFDATRKFGEFRVFTKLEEIGCVDGEETIENIAKFLPAFGILKFHKSTSSGNHSIYPHASGSLTAVKLVNSSRVSFIFERIDMYCVGFFDELNTQKMWSGWTNLLEVGRYKTLCEGAFGNTVVQLNDNITNYNVLHVISGTISDKTCKTSVIHSFASFFKVGESYLFETSDSNQCLINITSENTITLSNLSNSHVRYLKVYKDSFI